jgi:predicted transposase YdaD
MGTFSERFLQQGLEQGLAQGEQIGMRKGEQIGMRKGEQIGMRKGEARVLLTLLRLKFGTVSEAVEARIDQADADTLLRWSGRVLSAGSIEDVVGDDG